MPYTERGLYVPTGASYDEAGHWVSGTLTESGLWVFGVPGGGTTYYQAVAGTFGDITGALARATRKGLAGLSGDFAGALARKTEKALGGEQPAPLATLDDAVSFGCAVAGELPAPSGAITAFRFFLAVAGTFGAITGALAKLIRVDRSGEMPEPSGGVAKRSTRAATGTFGAITGEVATELNPEPTVSRVFGLIGSLFRRLLG